MIEGLLAYTSTESEEISSSDIHKDCLSYVISVVSCDDLIAVEHQRTYFVRRVSGKSLFSSSLTSLTSIKSLSTEDSTISAVIV